MDKGKLLSKIAEEIAKCRECRNGKSGTPVPGEGNPDANIVLMGEAPGATEAKTGRPFVGRAGKFLNKMLDKNGIKREDVFITSPVKYFPGNRAPTLEEISHGMTHTRKQIGVIRPKMIVLMGNTAIRALLGDLRVSDIHGKIIEKDGMKYFPTFHPSAAMRFTNMRLRMESDFKKLKPIIK